MNGKEDILMEDLLQILSDLHPDIDFEMEDALIDDMILDSFDIVTLIAEISDNFDVTISAEHIIPENFNSAEALYALIQKLEEE
jgi:acyl carrier protein